MVYLYERAKELREGTSSASHDRGRGGDRPFMKLSMLKEDLLLLCIFALLPQMATRRDVHHPIKASSSLVAFMLGGDYPAKGLGQPIPEHHPPSFSTHSPPHPSLLVAYHAFTRPSRQQQNCLACRRSKVAIIIASFFLECIYSIESLCLYTMPKIKVLHHLPTHILSSFPF